jgi:hypothetical protein
MKASKFSEAQKAFILKQGADGVPVAEICRKAGISQAVIPPFLAGRVRRTQAAIFNFWAGVIPPMPMLGLSLL